ncbi:MAG: HAMP domain-containing protein [Nitrospirae bacterium]|nr:HAMP domain-containing protein [Nitrospirota bacterium]
MAIRTKLAIWFSILVVVVLSILTGIRYTGYKRILQSQKDYSLKVVADVLDSSIPRRIPAKDDVQSAVERMNKEYPDIELKGILIEVYDPSRAIIFSSSISEAERFPVTEEMWGKIYHREMSLTTLSIMEGLTSMRVLTKPIFNRNKLVYIIQVGSSLHDIQTTLENILLLNLLFIPATTILLGGGGWILTKRALKPLDTVIRASHTISSGDLQHRIEVSDKTSREIRDLTAAFNQMIIRLETSFRQIRDFSENVSHELRIPLSILRGQTELSLRRLRSGGEYKETLESNLEEILRMEMIVERLLFLSKADRGEIELKKVELDVEDLLRYVYNKLRIPAREKNVHMTLDTNGPVLILGDDLFVRELLLNLVQNAIVYTPAGGDVALSLCKRDTVALVSFADTGCGIPEDEVPYIFDRFYQVDKSRSNQGHGLGLSLCKWIVEAHQGKLSVESTVGKGSRFTVTFPLKD